MSGAKPPVLQYAFMASCSVKSTGTTLLRFTLLCFTWPYLRNLCVFIFLDPLQKTAFSCSQQPATGRYLSQLNPIHIFPTYFPKIHSDISSHLRLGLPNGSKFPTKILYVSSYACYTSRRSHTLCLN